MIYKAVEVIWIFLADGTEIEGSIRGPCGPKKFCLVRFSNPIATGCWEVWAVGEPAVWHMRIIVKLPSSALPLACR